MEIRTVWDYEPGLQTKQHINWIIGMCLEGSTDLVSGIKRADYLFSKSKGFEHITVSIVENNRMPEIHVSKRVLN